MAKIDRMTGKDWAEAHERGLKGARDIIEDGVRAVKESPGKKAVDRADVWKEKISSDETFELWKKKTNYDLEYWRRLMETKGIKNIATGLEATREKRAMKGEKLLAAIQEVRKTLPKEKPKDIDEAIDRFEKYARAMHEKKGTI